MNYCNQKYCRNYVQSRWCCVPLDFVAQNNNFFNLVLFSAVIHKRGGRKLISKTIKYKLDRPSKMSFVFFILNGFKNIFGKLSILTKIWKWRNKSGWGVRWFASLWRSAYENRYVINSLVTDLWKLRSIR